LPSNILSVNGTNNANVWISGEPPTLGAPYYRTEVGAFGGSPSTYGTFDQTGNVYEWLEESSYRFNGGEDRWEYYHGMTGGSYAIGVRNASHPYEVDTLAKDPAIGFRVALVPEPGTLGLLAAGGFGLFLRRRLRAVQACR
jgi:formylglycine-generating enzyme required for sulfatase activity